MKPAFRTVFAIVHLRSRCAAVRLPVPRSAYLHALGKSRLQSAPGQNEPGQVSCLAEGQSFVG